MFACKNLIVDRVLLRGEGKGVSLNSKTTL